MEEEKGNEVKERRSEIASGREGRREGRIYEGENE